MILGGVLVLTMMVEIKPTLAVRDKDKEDHMTETCACCVC